MTLTNKLKVQVDIPVWEWCRTAPAVSSAISCSCTPDNSLFSMTNGRYIYYLIAAAGFWRYDTWTDTYEQLASPLNAPATVSSMRFAGAQGYFGRVISASTNTITTGLPFGGSVKGYKIRIISGKGAGQERYITYVADPVVADYGAASGAGTATTLIDATKTWTSGYTGAALNFNNWVGYSVRIILGTGLQQVRKILYNNATTLTIGDVNKHPEDPWCHTTWTAPAAGTLYQIESSVVTVDTAWDVVPDNTSRYVIQAGGIWLLSGAAATPFFTMQYYDILADVWYVKPTLTNMMAAAPSDACMERVTENSSLWDMGTATGTQSATTVQDTSKNWSVNAWAGYYVYIITGTGHGQISKITSNTSNTLTLASTWSSAPDATSRYQITGFDAGTSTSSTANTLVDSSKTWVTNRWANYAVRILYGTGMGQARSIKSNTATALSLYNGWTVQPDSTSVYLIQGDTSNIYFSWGGAAEIFLYRTEIDQLSHGRILDSGIACTACALMCDSNHTIYEQLPIAISGLAGTTTITATTVNAHSLKPGQYVSIRGITSAAADQYNVSGLVQVLAVPSTTTFTYTPSSAGSGTYSYLAAQSTSLLSDASKDYRALCSSGASGAATISFSSNTPSNINGWYVSGTGIGSGAQVISGAGTTTLTLSVNNSGTVTGNVVTLNAWTPSVSGTYSSGGAAGALTVTLSANTPSYINGWYAAGTGVGIGAVVTAGAGTSTVTFSVVNTAQISGTITFSNPWGGTMLYFNSSAVTVTTGVSTGQAMQITTNTGNSLSLLAAAGAAPANGTSRYVISRQAMLGAANEGSSTTYYSGVATGGSTTSVVDANAFWTSASGNGGSAQSTTITLGSACPANCTGWYLTAGTGVNVGAQVVSGAGTTSITVSVANSGAVSGSLTLCAWNTSALVGKRIKFLSSGGVTQELPITAYTAATGTIGFATATAPTNNATSYSIISAPAKGAGSTIQWVYGLSDTTRRGKFIFSARGGAAVGIDRLDLTTDQWNLMYNIPAAEVLGSGSMYAYDGGDRLFFTKDVTQRVYYLDLNTNWIHGAGLYPYAAGTAIIGNRMEIFTTADGLNYLWLNRHSNIECFRLLIFY